MLVIIIGIAVLAILFYRYLVRYYNFWTYQGVEQGKPVLIFGDSWKLILRRQSFAELMQDVYFKCPGTRYCGVYNLFIPVLVIKDLELMKQLTVKDFDHFTDHMTFLPADSDPLWAKNLFALTGQKWNEMRHILSPSFTSSKMRSLFLLMEECSESCVQHFLKKNDEILTLEIKDVFTRFTNDIIASTAFGIKIDSLNEPNNEFYLMGKEVTKINTFGKTLLFVIVFLCPWLYKVMKVRLFSDEVSRFFRKVIDDTIKIRKEKGIVRPDMIHLLMQARKGVQKHEETDVIDTGFATAQQSGEVKEKITTLLTNEDITAQALLFFFAGFDTVASFMCFTCYELAVNQDIQNRLRKEIRSTYKECSGKLTYESLLKMKYLDMVVSETLRKWPINVAVDRVCTKPYTIQSTTAKEKPVHLKPGALLWFPTYAIHRNPEYYPDPDRFDPERFNDENKDKIKPYTYLPFGIGPRNCIGSRFALLETKTVLFKIMLHYEFVPIEKTVIPLKISKETFPLNSEGGMWIGLKRIKTT